MSDAKEVFVGEAEFYCVCSGTDVPHDMLVNLRPDATCSDLTGITTRCGYCGVEQSFTAAVSVVSR